MELVIAVVGGRGVIGAAIVQRLRAAGEDVVTVSHSPLLIGIPGFRYGDLLAPETLASAVDGAEVVIQSANFRSYPMERARQGETFDAFDGIGTERLVAAAQRAGVRRYVFISGAGARHGADKPYWNALRRGEAAVLGAADMEGVCVEPTLVFGPRDRGLNRMLGFALKAGFVPLVGSGEERHQPVFVSDVAELVARVLPAHAPQGAFAIGGPEQMTMNSLIRRALAAAGVSRPVVHVPAALSKLGAVLLRQLPGELLSPAAIDFVLEDFIADVDPVCSTFGLTLTRFEQGLSTYLPNGGSASSRSL